MIGDYDKHPSLEEIYALIDKNRVAAAKAAESKFRKGIEGAIAAIVSIETIAGARIQMDSRIASAKVVIHAEQAATRLLAEAEAQASEWAIQALTKPKDVVRAALMEIGKQTSLQLVANANESIESIQQDVEAALKVLRGTRANAVSEVQATAAEMAEQTKREAEVAAEKLKEYRKQPRTAAAAASDGEDLAGIVIKAAEQALVKSQKTLNATLDHINAVTDAACLAVHEAAVASKRKIEEGLEQALARLQETLKTYS